VSQDGGVERPTAGSGASPVRDAVGDMGFAAYSTDPEGDVVGLRKTAR
jgi:hypothetical protein